MSVANQDTRRAAADVPVTLTARIARPPLESIRHEVLEPQFHFEAQHLLRYYVLIEKVLLVEYHRMGLIGPAEVAAVSAVLDGLTADQLRADAVENLCDIAFAIERAVTTELDVPAWHVDRSRNDLQACVQLMSARDEVLRVVADLLCCAASARRLADRYTGDIMPGYTHLQAAQVITPGFFASAISAHVQHTVSRMLATYDGINLCPLGGGAMAGQELPWDRRWAADVLGFAGPQPHALVGVAGRGWALEFAADCATFGVGLSRFVTDLMTWCGSEYGFAELPDELAAISSAMPQKKNYPVLERIRGRLAHLPAWYLDVATVQHGTPYSNTVEVSKEGLASVRTGLTALRSALALFIEVLDNLEFRTDRLRARCAEEYLGAFSLANRLSLAEGVRWRDAQVIAGRYVLAALRAGRRPAEVDAALLADVADGAGYRLTDPAGALDGIFDPSAELARRCSDGSAHPARVTELLEAQAAEQARLTEEWTCRRNRVDAVEWQLDRLLEVAARERGGA